MSDTSIIEDDDDFELPEEDLGTSDEGEGAAADEGALEDDAGEEGDDEGQGEGRQEGLDRQPRRSTRANDRIRRSVETARVEKDRADRFERELQELRGQIQGRPDPVQEARRMAEEAARLELMSPEERVEYRVAQSEQRLRNEFQQREFARAEEGDRTSFESMARTNPLARKYAPEVERLVSEHRRNGQVVTRRVALAHLIGMKALDKAGTTAPDTRTRRRVEGTRTTPPGRTSGDQGRQRTARGDDSEAALERRLAGHEF